MNIEKQNITLSKMSHVCVTNFQDIVEKCKFCPPHIARNHPVHADHCKRREKLISKSKF